MDNIKGTLSNNLMLILIIIFGITLKLVAIALFDHLPESDELAYESIALNITSGHGIVDFMGNHAMYNIGYPLFILAPLFAVFGKNIWLVRIIHAVLGGIAIILVHAVAKEAGAGKLGRLLAAAIWAVYLPASVYSIYLLKENLMVPLMLGLILMALRLMKNPNYLNTLACGLLLGLLALTGNAALCLITTVALAVVLSSSPAKHKLWLTFCMLTVSVLVTTPWLIRNQHVLGASVLNTNGGFNLYLGNNPMATGRFVSIADTPRGTTWETLRQQGEVKSSDTLKSEAIAWIKENPMTFINLAVKKAVFFWTPPFHQGKGKGSAAETLVRIIWAIQFIALLLAAIGSLVISPLRNRATSLLWLSIVSYTGVHMLFYVIFRYREPIMPFVCVLAALTLEYLVVHWINIKAAKYNNLLSFIPPKRYSS